MAGSVSGGKKTAKILMEREAQYFERIGKIGGSSGKAQGTIKGFAAQDPALVSEYGRLGGTLSRKGGKHTLSKHKVDSIKREYNDRVRLLREQSQMQVSSLSAKYGQKRSW